MTRVLLAFFLFAGVIQTAAAECRIWAIEDTSAAQQRRERLFASSDLRSMDALVAEAAAIARRRAEARELDFVDIFLTRPQDGTERDFHMASTTTVWMRYNPGGTPVIDGVWLADALEKGADVEMQYGMLIGDRLELNGPDIQEIVASAPEGVSSGCSE